jgi:hypothetical protein
MEQLTEEQRKKLDGIVTQMTADGESSANIQFVVDDFKSLYEGKTNAVAEETVPAIAENQSDLDSQPLDTSLEQPIIPEKDTWIEEEFGSDTFGVDFASDMYRAAFEGWDSSAAAGEIADVFAGDSSDRALDLMRDKMEVAASSPPSEEMQDYNNKVAKYKEEGDGGFLAGIKALASNPTVAPLVMVSSLAGMGGTALEGGKVTGMVAAATAAGAAAGTAGLGFGAVAGGFAGLRGSAMLAMETTGTFSSLLKEAVIAKGGKFENNADIRSVLEDPEAMASLQRKAIGRGVTIGAIEAITGGIAGKVGAKAVGKTFLKKLPALTKAVAVEAVGGGLGEFGGMLAAGQEIAGEEIFMEGIAGTVMAPVSIAAEGISNNPEYHIGGKKVKADKGSGIIEDMVDNATDEDFAGMRVNIKNNKPLADKVQERRKKIIKENKSTVKNKIQPEVVTDAKNDIDFKIQQLEAEAKELEGEPSVVIEAVKRQIEDLKKEKKGLDDFMSYQIDEMDDSELLGLMNMDDEISMYQSVVNDPGSSPEAIDIAKKEVAKLKAVQVAAVETTNSADLANPEGPTRESNIKLSEKTQKAWEKGGVKNYSKIAEYQMGTIKSIATSLWSRVPEDLKVGTYDDFVSGIISDKGGLRDMVAAYDPIKFPGVPLAAYLGDRRKGLRVRANRIVKNFTKQDFETSTDSTEALNQFGEEQDINAINLGPRYNSQKLGLSSNILESAVNDVELGLIKTEGDLLVADNKVLDSEGKPLTKKQRQATAEKSYFKLFDNKYGKQIKELIGKKEKFSKYVKDNVTTLRKIALANNAFPMGRGIAKDWGKYPPTDQEFINYYEGADILPTQPASTKSDRKAALVEAITKQIANDSKEAYFEDNPKAQEEFNLENKVSFQEDDFHDMASVMFGLKVFASYNLEAAEFAKAHEKEANFRAYVNKLYPDANTLNPTTNSADRKLIIDSLIKVALEGKLDPQLIRAAGVATGRITGGFLFENQSDEQYKELIKAANENYKGETSVIGASFNGKNLTNSDNSINVELFKKRAKDNKPEVEKTQQALIKLTKQVKTLIDEGMNPHIAMTLLHTSMAASQGLVKKSYEYKMYEIGKLEKEYAEETGEVYRLEHSPPAGVLGAEILKIVKDATSMDLIDARFKDLFNDAGLNVISKKADGKLRDAKFPRSIPEGAIVGMNSGLIRYIKAGINPKSIVDVNGRSIYDISQAEVGLPEVVASEAALSKLDTVEEKLQMAYQEADKNNPDPKLTNEENVNGFSDILENAYEGAVTVFRTAQEAIDFLVSKGIKPGAAAKMVENKGFRGPGFIYVNPKKAKSDTPMHEFTHEWTRGINAKDPDLFNAIYEKLKAHPLYAKAIKRMADSSQYSKFDVESFEYKDEILAYILGEEGGSMYDLFKGDSDAKSLVDQFFQYVAEALGFDPSITNFADLTVAEVVSLAVKDIVEGNPSSNFNKLQNKMQGKGWMAKSIAAESPSAKAKSDPVTRAFNRLKLSYRESKDLGKAISDSYKYIDAEMSFLEWARLIAKYSKEVPVGKSTQLLIGKAAAIKANEIAKNAIEKSKAAEIKAEDKSKLQKVFRRMLYVASAEGNKPSKWFLPPNAEDFKGLLYAFLPKGKAGIAAKKFLQDHLIKPYSDAITAYDTEVIQKVQAWKSMSKGFDFLKKVKGTPYTIGDAIKVYNGIKKGQDPKIAKKQHLDALIHAVESNKELLDFTNEMEGNFPVDLKSGWQSKSLSQDVIETINRKSRKAHLETFTANKDAIFTDATLDLIADQFGVPFKQALLSTFKRMQTGRNSSSNDANASKYINWLTKAVGTTMFLNVRSGVLQFLSAFNYINKPGNNIFQAVKAVANFSQFKKDVAMIFKSDYLKNRREGAKFDVLADEIVQGDEGKGSLSDKFNWIQTKILEFGFLPTKYADSSAIALGGASFYRNRVNSLIKEGYTKADAEIQAMTDLIETSEESQQSSDPSKISEIQASSIGKIIYAFANTPFQYARITKRKYQDLTSGRSAAEGNVKKDMSTIFYYAVAQAALFNALQSGLLALMMSGDEDDEENIDEKQILAIERVLTGFAKSTGNPGAVASTLYSMLKEAHMQQTGKRRKDADKIALTATSISPALNSKLRDLMGAYRAYNKIEEGQDFEDMVFDGERWKMAGEVTSFAAGLPLDRVVRKINHLKAIADDEVELWQKVWMTFGWSEWELNVDKKEAKFKKPKFKKQKFEKPKFEKPKFEKSPNKRLENGVAGRANNDGTIEIDPNLSPIEREKTIAHEEKHMKDMESGKLAYNDDNVTWNGKKYKRENGKIMYNGKALIEGDPSLPWEKVAYAAEPSESAIKRRLY